MIVTPDPLSGSWPGMNTMRDFRTEREAVHVNNRWKTKRGNGGELDVIINSRGIRLARHYMIGCIF